MENNFAIRIYLLKDVILKTEILISSVIFKLTDFTFWISFCLKKNYIESTELTQSSFHY